MQLDRKEQNEIINSTYTKFSSTKTITYEYISAFLNAILMGETTYDLFKINIPHLEQSTNLSMDIKYVIQNNIYYKLCQQASEDADILIFLIEDKSSVANLVLRKLGINDFSKMEDYLIEAIPLFKGEENFNTFLTRYIMSSVKGTPFKTKEDIERTSKVQPEVTQMEKKKKKKKKHSQQPFIAIQSPSVTPEKKSIIASDKIAESNSLQNISSTMEQPAAISSMSRTTTDEKTKRDNSSLISEEPSNQHIIPPIEEGNQEPIELAKEETIIEADVPKSIPKTTELSPDIASFNPFLECQKRCQGIIGTGTIDPLIRAAQEIRLVEKLDSQNNSQYEMYILLRLGFINNSFYSKEEISTIIGITIADILFFERQTWNIIKTTINNKFSSYSDYILNKKF